MVNNTKRENTQKPHIEKNSIDYFQTSLDDDVKSFIDELDKENKRLMDEIESILHCEFEELEISGEGELDLLNESWREELSQLKMTSPDTKKNEE